MATLQLVLATIVLVLAAEVSCLPGGAPGAACPGLSPSPASTAHRVGPQVVDDDNPVPYILEGFADAFPADEDGMYVYEPGMTYSFNVTSRDGQTAFRGVLLQGRMMMDDSAVGTFNVVDDNTQESGCTPPESGVTHNNNNDKMSVYLEWVAPPAGTGSVTIGWAVVQEVEIYWANLRSPVLVENSSVVTTGSLLLLAVLGLVATAI